MTFRGSIAWPSSSLSTLRRVDHPTQRKTRFQVLVRLSWTGLITRRVPSKGFRVASYISSPFPQAWLGANPMVTEKALLFEGATNVVDFGRYSAFVVGEILLLLEELEERLREECKIGDSSMTPSMRYGDFEQLLAGLRRLAGVSV